MTIESVRRHIQRKSFVKKSKSLVTADDLYLITKIFEKKNWMDYFGHEKVLGNYLDMLGKLNENQKSLFLDLTSRFHWQTDYTKDIVDLLNKILTEFKSYENYYVIRCIKKEDQRKSKSSGVVLYEIKNPQVKSQLVKQVIVLDNMSDLTKQVKDFKTSLFILVDDFVGTGDTAVACMDDLKEKAKEIEGRMVIMCVAALKQGKERLKELDVPVITKLIQGRGIRDYYKGDSLVKNIELMNEMETIFQVRNNHFGYKESEGLICLKRCPNNTFPIYWHGKNSPYPRY